MDPDPHRNVIGLLKNPFYAGAYAYGNSKKRVDGEWPREEDYGHGKPFETWEILIKKHHKFYID